jgi:hypothetical protein
MNGLKLVIQEKQTLPRVINVRDLFDDASIIKIIELFLLSAISIDYPETFGGLRKGDAKSLTFGNIDGTQGYQVGALTWQNVPANSFGGPIQTGGSLIPVYNVRLYIKFQC